MASATTNPFGNGKGAPPSGAASGGNDFVKNPSGSGAKTGGHDFIQDPGDRSPKTGGRDFSAESRKQPTSTDASDESGDVHPDQQSPERFIKLDPPPSRSNLIGTTADPGQRKPFKL